MFLLKNTWKKKRNEFEHSKKIGSPVWWSRVTFDFVMICPVALLQLEKLGLFFPQ